jgi:hypothetical protein
MMSISLAEGAAECNDYIQLCSHAEPQSARWLAQYGNAVFWRSNLLELIREVAQRLSMQLFGFWLKWYFGNVGCSGEGYGVSLQAALCSHMQLAQALYLLLSSALHVFTRVAVRHVVYSTFTAFLSRTFQNNLLRVLYKKSQTKKVSKWEPATACIS